jgi:hypothetical protein
MDKSSSRQRSVQDEAAAHEFRNSLGTPRAVKLRSVLSEVCEVLRRREHGNPIPNGLRKML